MSGGHDVHASHEASGTRNVLYAASNMKHIRDFHLPYIEFLRARGDKVTVLAHGAGADIDLPMEKSILSPVNLRSILRAARLFRKETYDLVVLNTSLAAFILRMGIRLSGKRPGKVVNIVHGYLFDASTNPIRRALMIFLEKLCSGVTDVIAVMNQYDFDIAKKHRLTRCGGQIVMTHGMGVDIHRFTPVPDDEKKRLRGDTPFNPDDIVLICAAEFTSRKNQRFLIKCLPELFKNVPHMKLILAGDGALLGKSKALVKRLGISDNVWFPGHQPDMENLYCASDIYVSASKSEGLPLSIMEAMACGLPCVLSNVKGHTDLLENGGGSLFALNDTNDYINKTKMLTQDEAKRIQYGCAAHEAVRAYEKDRAVKEIGGLFEYNERGALK